MSYDVAFSTRKGILLELLHSGRRLYCIFMEEIERRRRGFAT